ncbi:hypothetical protein Q5688_23765 [Microcoleus sp. herbarium5]
MGYLVQAAKTDFYLTFYLQISYFFSISGDGCQELSNINKNTNYLENLTLCGRSLFPYFLLDN